MTGREIIKDIMEREGKRNAEVADMLNISPAALWDRLNTKKTKDIPLSTMNEMLRVLGYKVAIVPRTHRVSDGYTVD